MSLNERIAKIIEYSELTSSEFADAIDVQRSSISHITSGRNKPSLDFLIKVKEHFPELQWDWLINGDGEMLISKIPEEENKKTESTSLPDLFSLINDENFGYTESEDRIQKEVPQKVDFEMPREFSKTESHSEKNILSDSQRLEIQESKINIQNTENQIDKVKRIVLFYESGKFESFEP